MFNDTKKAWILGHEISDWRFGKAKEQIRILAKESRSEGYTVVGSTEICEPIVTMDSLQKIEPMMGAVRRRQIDAVFVMSIRHICEDLDRAFRFVDELNRHGVVVYDNEGATYSHDWVCKQIGKRFKG